MEEDKNYYINQNIDNSGIASARPQEDVVTRMAMLNPIIGNLNVGQYFDKVSLYDSTIGDVRALEQQGVSVNDVRAAKQGIWSKIGNALVNNAVIAGTTAVGNTVGLIDGLLEAAATGDVSKIWDNGVNNYLVGLQQSVQEAMPIYRGKDYEEASVWDRLTTGVFWADMIQNLGYLEGMLLPAGGMAKMLSSAPKLIRRFLPTVINSVSEAATEAIHAKDESINTKITAANLQYNQAYAKLLGDSMALDILYDDYLKTISEIKEDAIKAGNFTFALNSALLAATSTFEFSRVFDKGFGTAKRIRGALNRQGEGLTSEYSGSVGKYMALEATKKVVDSFAEGSEELLQGVISSTADNYAGYNRFAKSEFNPQKIEVANDLLSAMGLTFSLSMNDKEAWTEFMMGFATGAIGAPMLNAKGRPILANNTALDLYNAYKEAKKEPQLADQINQRIAEDPKIRAYYRGLVNHLASLDRMNAAIDNDDAFDYHNSQAELLISDIMMFDEAGDIENLKTIINESVDVSSDEAIQDLVQLTTNPLTGEGPFVNNGVIDSPEEIRRAIEEKKQVLNNKIDQYLTEKRRFQVTNPKANEDQQRAAMYLGMQRRDHFDRYKSLSREITQDINELAEDIGSLNPTEQGKLLNVGELYLNNKDVKQAVEELLSSPLVPQSTRDQINSKLNDIQKLKTNLEKLTEEYNKIIAEPNKATEIRNKAQQEAQLNINSKNTIDVQQRVQNSSISDLVNNHYNGTEDINALDTEINQAEGFLPNKDKVKAAKDIIESRASIGRRLANKVNSQLITQEEADIALNLLNRSTTVAQSRDELMDLETEAYNSIDSIELEDGIINTYQQLIDDGNITEEGARDSINNIKQSRLDNAKNILNELFEEERQRIAAVANTPTTINNTPATILNTGHDAVDANTPVNGVNATTETNKDIATRIAGKHPELIPLIEQYLDSADTILNNNPNITRDEYEKLLPGVTVGDIATRASTAEAALNKFDNRKNTGGTTVINTPEIPTVVDELDERTPWDNANWQLDRKEETPTKVNGSYTHWGSMTSEEARGNATGDHSPYYTRKGVKNANVLEILYKFLEKHNVFNNIRNNKVKPKDKVHFGFSKELNDQGIPVLLILNENNEVIGDLPLPTDATFNAYAGLSDFYASSKEFFDANKDATDGDIVVVPGESTVSKMMIGKPNYSTLSAYLNNISTQDSTNGTNNNQGFKLGIAVGNERGTRSRIMVDAGRRKSEGPSTLEEKVLQPLNATKGLPYILVETSDPNRRYYCVPFNMPLFNTNNELGNLVAEHINSLSTVGTNQDALIKWCDELKDLLAILDIKVYANEDGSFTIQLLNKKDEEYLTFRGNVTTVSTLLLNTLIDKASYQVSRKYINSTYKGRNYNELIGTVAYTNLGSLHTVNDWFTINPIVGGTETKAKNPKSTGLNSNANTGNRTRVSEANGTNYYLDDKNNLYLEDGDKLVEGHPFDVIKAYAYGIRNKEPMTKPYDTPWGTYYPQEGRLEAPKKDESEVTLGENLDLSLLLDDSVDEADNTITREEALKTLDNADLINSEDREYYLGLASDDNLIQLSQLPTVLTNLKLGILDSRLSEDSSEAEINEAIKSVLDDNTLLKEATDESAEVFDFDKEVNKVLKMLPKLAKEGAIRLCKGLIKISNSRNAYGSFKDGIITISDKAARGTVYHEAFHYVSLTLLTRDELNALYAEAKEHFGTSTNLATEEELAESFRMYMQNREDSSFFSNIFSDLKHLVKRLFGKASIMDKLFFDIRRSRLANRTPINQGNQQSYYQKDYQIEIEQVKKKAIADGTFMKAPNGNPTNLNERQWLQVRTKSFKEWFGDWINNPSEASKVVDENGEPLVVYHGNRTNNKITIFNENKKGSEHRERTISGFWFVTDKEIAKTEYAIKPESVGKGEEYLEYGEILPVFLNIKTPVITEQQGITINDTPYGLFTTARENINDFIERSKNKSNENTDGYILTLVDSDNRNDDFVSKQTQLLVFNPNQIKSATSNNGGFSTTNDNIYYREKIVDELGRETNVYRIHNRLLSIKEQINIIKDKDFNAKIQRFNKAKFLDYKRVEEFKKNYKVPDVVYGFFNARTGSWMISKVSEDNRNKLLSKLKHDLEDLWYQELEDDVRLSNEALLALYDNEIQLHYRDNYEYSSLDQEDKDYISERGITLNDYSNMSLEEKETLLHCKY